MRNVADLGTATRGKLYELAETIRLYDAGDRAAALRLVMTDAGKRSMDEIRLVIARMERAESARYADNLQRETRARQLSLASGWATAGLAVALLGLLALIVRRDTAQIRASEIQLATTLRSIGDAVIATDKMGRIVLMNPVAESLTGWPLSSARGRALEEVFRIINEYTRATVESPVAKVLREGTIVGLANHTLLIRRDGAEAPIADSGAPILGAHSEVQGVVLVFRDASQERNFERAMRDADRRKDEFLATLSHELRNPLAPIRQAVSAIRAPAVTQSQMSWCVDVIERQVQNMARLLDDLLDVSRITHGTLEVRKIRVDARSVLDAAVELARPIIDGKHHTLTITCPVGIALDADPMRLAQVIGNLLTNAAKYTDPHGRIQLTGHPDATHLSITISDNGVGLSEDMLPRVFEMFIQVQRTKERSDGGLGIGLALAKGLVELHGGSIEARSAGLGKGSDFIVRLPLRTAAPPPDSSERPKPSASANTMRILVADDNGDGAESLAMLLRLEGHEVCVARDGKAALGLLESFQPEIALLDIGMPGLNGHEVAARTRAAAWGKTIKLIALTGWGQEHDRRDALAAGFDRHFVKPIDTYELLRAISPGNTASPGGS